MSRPHRLAAIHLTPISVDAWTAFALGCAATAMLAVLLHLRMSKRARLEGQQAREPEVLSLRERMSELRDEVDLARDACERERERASRLEQERETRLGEHAQLQGRLEQLHGLQMQLASREQELTALRARSETLYAQAAALKVRLDEESRSGAERIALLERVRGEFADAFRSLSGDILDERAQRLAADNGAQLAQILDPLRGELRGMQDSVQRAYGAEALERTVLAREIESLRALNQQINVDAQNLTRALRGDTRMQGAWGELLLARVLESAGLREGHEYTTQAVLRDEAGGRPRPDVIVHLPQQRDLVIDAKVSLTAYERALASEDASIRAAGLAEHLLSLRRHIDGLAKRDYTQWLTTHTLDFVLLFVPIESALIAAVGADAGLYEYALERNIALVSPSTLAVTLRAVAHLWKQDQRHRNAQEIANRAGRLYDRFVGFVADLEAAREAQQRALIELDQAYSKLRGGRGNLVRQAEQLRELGARTQKRLPASMLDAADDEESDQSPH